MYFLINNTLDQCTMHEMFSSDRQYVAVLTSKVWEREKEYFDMGIDIEPKMGDILVTKAEVNYDSITGTFAIPNRRNMSHDNVFSFALDEKGIVFIDDNKTVENIIRKIQITKKWRLPSLERFLFDFLILIISDDLRIMEHYEHELDNMELAIINDNAELASSRINDIRSDIRDLKNHYEQLIDLGEVFEENENHFFKTENIRYFRLFLNRLDRLQDTSSFIRDYTIQVRDVYTTQLDIKQNHIMSILTIVTTIFTPLMFVVGWYGMNFQFMPELHYKMAYPMVMLVCIIITIMSIAFFKNKKWL